MPPTPETCAVPLNYFEEMEAALRKQGQNIIDGAVKKLKFNQALAIDGVLVPGSPRATILN